MFQRASTSQAPLTSTPLMVGFARQIPTMRSRHSSPRYWRLPSATRSRIDRLKRLPGRPSRPARRSRIITSPSRVRGVTSARSMPTMRSKPSSGAVGLASQWLSLPLCT